MEDKLKQAQKAGDNAMQLQAQNITFIQGIDEKRAREICEEILQTWNRYTAEATNIAVGRVREFADRLIPKMEVIEKGLETIADPSFQFLLAEAQKTAAKTERSADYDLLSELLIQRIEKGEDRNARTGINHAVEIVDELSDEALLGLTITHTVSSIIPTSGDIMEGLNVLDDIFQKVIYNEVPVGTDWVEQLYILRAIRINEISTFKKIRQYYSEQLEGYVAIGIEKETESYNKAIRILQEANIPSCFLVDHYLNPNYIRLPIANQKGIDDMAITYIQAQSRLTIPLSAMQKQAIKSIYGLYRNDSAMQEQILNRFMEEWNKRPNLNTLRNWWDSLSPQFNITAIGQVLARANARRCDPSLPPLK
ncbi:MAG: hypothetical protein LBL78_05910 [Prevotellaceae bacterium]|jgi:hypothetical protein|nr:hypothetical protein [Prevotellaceae bacterium]